MNLPKLWPQTGVNNFDPYPAGTDFTGCFQKPHIST